MEAMTKPALDRRARLQSLREFRTRMYAFLSSAFKEPPGTEALEALRSDGTLDSIAELLGEEVVGDLSSWLRNSPDLGELGPGLEREFMDLFRIPGGQYVTPYESVFRDTSVVAGKPVRGLLSGQSAIDVKGWYRLARFEISPDYQDLPDHVTLELRFMAELCAKEQELEDEDDLNRLDRAWEMERDFLAGHLAAWIGKLCEKIETKTQHPYFLYVSRLVRAFAHRDLATLEELLGPSDGSPAPNYEAVEP